jgi:hypothetical protein
MWHLHLKFENLSLTSCAQNVYLGDLFGLENNAVVSENGYLELTF